MNNKGNFAQVGTLIAIFVGIVFATALLTGGIFESIGTVTNTQSVVNQTLTYSPTTVLSGRAVVGTVTLVNASNGLAIGAGNFTVVNDDVSTGVLRSYITNLTNTATYPTVKATYTYQALGYATDAGSRAVTSLIAVFAVLAVIGVIIYKIYNDGLLDFM